MDQRELIVDGTTIICHKNGKIEQCFKGKYWYHSTRNTTIITINKHNYKISHLIYKAWNPDFNDCFVCHFNKISTDNRLENLYSTTRNPSRNNEGKFTWS